MIRHAGLVALQVDGRWRGALIEGGSGRGKSDLMIRALDLGLRLVADDRTVVFVSGERLFGTAPRSLEGLIEVRGIGVVGASALRMTEILVRIHCVGDASEVERTPDLAIQPLLGVKIPTLNLRSFEASAPHKLILVLRHLGVGS